MNRPRTVARSQTEAVSAMCVASFSMLGNRDSFASLLRHLRRFHPHVGQSATLIGTP